ncbi:helix-turn-helix domain-containing protein [Nocardiopsis sp. B62]|nr:helix-turn-helix domain-containing protein [Nocardiopsis sp. B62]
MNIGRFSEEAHVTRVLEDAQRGHGGAMAITGDIGTGKSGLLEFARESARRKRGPTTLHVKARGSSFVIESDLPGRVNPSVHDCFHEVLSSGALGLAETLGADRVREEARLVELLLSHLLAWAPIVLCVDDVDLLLPEAAGLVSLLSHRVSGHPVSVLLTYRDAAAHPDVPGLHPELRLGGLSRGATQDLLYARGLALPDTLNEVAHRATGGNPLALTELAETPRARESLAETSLSDRIPVGPRTRRSFGAVIEEIPAPERAWLLLAAAEARGRLGVVMGAGARLGLDHQGIREAENSGWLSLSSGALRFQNPVIRSVVYDMASFEERRRAHHAISDELAGSDGERSAWHRALVATSPDGVLAQSVEQAVETARRNGGEPGVAALFQLSSRLTPDPGNTHRRLLAAATAATNAGLPEWSSALLRRTFAINGAPVNPVPAATDCDPGEPETPRAAYSRLTSEGTARRLTDPDEAAWSFRSAAHAAHRMNDHEGSRSALRRILTLECAPPVREAARALSHDRAPGADQVSDLLDGLTQGGASADPQRWMWASDVACKARDQRLAQRITENAHQRLRSIRAAGMLPEVCLRQAHIALLDGRWSSGIAHSRSGLRLARLTGQERWAPRHHAAAALLSALHGTAKECHHHVGHALNRALLEHDRVTAAECTAALGLLELGRGRRVQAWNHFSSLVRSDSPLSHQDVALRMISATVEAAIAAGEVDDARDVLESHIALAGPTPDCWMEADIHHAQGLLAAASGDPRVEQHYKRAIALYEELECPFQLARVNLYYGTWLRRQRSRTLARAPLRSATQLFTALKATPWCDRSRSEERACGSITVAVGPVKELSPQESQVARLAAQGLSNREIGEFLSLSPRTVASHLYRIFPKLNITSRRQLRDIDMSESSSPSRGRRSR